MNSPDETFVVDAEVWTWRLPNHAGTWHFLTVDGQTSAEIRYAALGRTGGFGSIKVTATIGRTRWRTSIFPHRESGGFILPIKAEVRRNEGIVPGSVVTVQLAV